MDFNDTPDEAAFRAQVRGWLKQHAPSDSLDGADEGEWIAASKRWQARKFDAGYAAITWPREFGGMEGSPIQQVIYRQEESSYVPYGGIFSIGLGMCLPVVRSFGTAGHKQQYLRSGLRGEHVWCQLFSEPAAGSDVAGIRTRATRDGDQWVINGQKIWTSGAHYCDYGILLVRTNPKVPKHRGLTMFIVDMRAPGVTVRPVKQMSGRSDFNEVFFDGVRIPDGNRLGVEGDGWKVAVATLMFERHSVGGDLGFVGYADIVAQARRTRLNGRAAMEDARIRSRIADLYVGNRALELLACRAQTALSKGQTPGPEQSITKIVAAIEGQQASYLAMDLRDQAGLLTSAELGPAWAKVEFSWSLGAAMRIAGGSDEILRNIVAERVLGLPGDVRVDKDIPFDELQS